MGEITNTLLSFLQGKDPQTIRRLLARLEREAALEAAERAEDVTARRQAMASRSANDLAGELARLRSQQQFVDRAAYDETYRAYMKALEREQAASQQAPAYTGRSREAVQLELSQVQAQLSEMRQQPRWRIDAGGYSRLVDKHNVLISELQAAPSTPPPQPKKRQLSPLEEYLAEDGEGEGE